MVRLCLAAVFAFAMALTATAAEERGGATPDVGSMMKTMAEAAQPSAEHKKLEPLAGKFTYTCKFWMDPSNPPMETSGTIERKWIMDGRFLTEHVKGTGFDGKSEFEGGGVVGYDNTQKKFVSNWISTMGTGISTGVGTVDASGNNFTFETQGFCPIQKKIVHGRDELHIKPDGTHVMMMYQTENGQEQKMMELTATRQE